MNSRDELTVPSINPSSTSLMIATDGDLAQGHVRLEKRSGGVALNGIELSDGLLMPITDAVALKGRELLDGFHVPLIQTSSSEANESAAQRQSVMMLRPQTAISSFAVDAEASNLFNASSHAMDNSKQVRNVRSQRKIVRALPRGQHEHCPRSFSSISQECLRYALELEGQTDDSIEVTKIRIARRKRKHPEEHVDQNVRHCFDQHFPDQMNNSSWTE